MFFIASQRESVDNPTFKNKLISDENSNTKRGIFAKWKSQNQSLRLEDQLESVPRFISRKISSSKLLMQIQEQSIINNSNH